MQTYANILYEQKDKARLERRAVTRWRIGIDVFNDMLRRRAYSEVLTTRFLPNTLLGLPYRIDTQRPGVLELEGDA